MEKNIRKAAAKTAVDAFVAVERIYLHANQVLIALREELKTGLDLKAGSYMQHQAQASSDPKSWIYHYIALYLSKHIITLDKYLDNPTPLFFIQVSLFNFDNSEPVLRWGVLEKIIKVQRSKGMNLDSLFREIMAESHNEGVKNEIKTLHCRANVKSEYQLLLDVRNDSDIHEVSKKAIDNYGNFFL